jgi:hypothetical protein
MIARHERRLIETHAMLGTVAIITTTMAWAGHRRRGPDFRSRKQGPTKAPLGSKFRLIGLSVQANVFAGSKTSQAPIDNQTELAGNWAGGLDINRDEDFLRAAHEINRSAGTRGGRLRIACQCSRNDRRANIGAHHVHHLCSRIPYYRLPQTLRDNPDLRSANRITLFQSFRCVRLVLWDESGRRLVSFRDVRTQSLARRHFWAEPASYR